VQGQGPRHSGAHPARAVAPPRSLPPLSLPATPPLCPYPPPAPPERAPGAGRRDGGPCPSRPRPCETLAQARAGGAARTLTPSHPGRTHTHLYALWAGGQVFLEAMASGTPVVGAGVCRRPGGPSRTCVAGGGGGGGGGHTHRPALTWNAPRLPPLTPGARGVPLRPQLTPSPPP